MKKLFSKAYKQASKDLAREMSRQVKANATADGWPTAVAGSLSVSYDKGDFNVSHAPEHGTMVFDMEHGGEGVTGKGTLRKMHNSKDEQANRFATLLERAVIKL